MSLSKVQIRMANRHTKKMFMFQRKRSDAKGITEIQIKTTLRFHLTPVILTYIGKFINNTCWHGCGDKGALLVGVEARAATIEISMRLMKQLKLVTFA